MTEVAAPSRLAPSPEAHVARLRQRVETGLAELRLPEEPVELYQPVRYVLSGGGKRLRPVLLLLAAEAAGAEVEDALPAALAVEVFHNFTLVHDDIMDHASERRGRPTVHVTWNESTAILTGDLLMGLSYRLLSQTRSGDLPTLMERYHRMVAAVCEGQALDEAFESRTDVSVQDYLDMISRKTAALLVCALEMGGIIGQADQRSITRLAKAGAELGLAFQIQDDLLDLTAESADWGKTIGGDLIEGKKTFLLLRSLERASGDDKRWLQRIVDGHPLHPSDVPDARTRMDGLGVLQEAADQVERHSAAGIEALLNLPQTEARDTLVWLARRLSRRAR